MTQSSALEHQTFQPFPKIDTPLADTDGTLNISWYRLLMAMWQRLGQIGGQTINAAFIRQSPVGAGAPLEVVNSLTGKVIGTISLGNITPLPAVPQSCTSSPQTFTAPSAGTFVVESGQVELSRDSGATFYIFSLAGGAVPVLSGDQIRVTWYNVVPLVTLFPQLLS